MELFRTVSEIEADVGRKTQFSPYLTARIPLEFCNYGRIKKARMMALPDGEKVWRYVQSFRHNTDIL